MAKTLKQRRQTKHLRVRSKISAGTLARPRLNIFKSNTGIYAQIIDDDKGITIASASTQTLKLKGNNIENAIKVGQAIAENGKNQGVKAVVFDRGGYIYHGKVKALADAARKSGLEF
ncbi:MAG: 50S ribosomal protein L18 [Candidatus Tyloplasma litorale]|nr:MAG: 50S ribosomal protein L18 [Mycoplasmatales bacterium]